MTSWAKGAFAKGSLLLGSVVAALLIGEIGARVFGVAPVISRINPLMKKTVFRVSENPLLGYVFKENYRDADADLWTSYPYINAHGFRDREREYEKPANTKRIVVLGDSVVVGHIGIKSHDETISRELEKLLAPRGVEVLNIGVTGYNMRSEVELLEEEGLKYAPDLVMMIFVTNDYLAVNTDIGNVTPAAAVRYFFIRSHLFRYFGVRYNLCGMRDHFGLQKVAGEFAGEFGLVGHPRRQEIMESKEADSETMRRHLIALESERRSGLTNVHDGMPALRQLADERGFQVAIGLWPYFTVGGVVDYEGFGTNVAYAIDDGKLLHVERIAGASGIPTFRLSSYFRRHYEASLKSAGDAGLPSALELYGADTMHPNPLGARVAAEAIARILERNPKLLE